MGGSAFFQGVGGFISGLCAAMSDLRRVTFTSKTLSHVIRAEARMAVI